MIKHTFGLVGAISTLLLLLGCGVDSSSVQNRTVEPQQFLPTQVTNHLSSFKSRQQYVTSLPVAYVKDANHHVVTIPNTAVLYIDPTQKFAIEQFKEVWSSLKSKPVVIWVNTTPTNVKRILGEEGYDKNPLPSSLTFYTDKSISTPDAYRSNGGTWSEVPGVLRQNEVPDWVKFFDTKDGNIRGQDTLATSTSSATSTSAVQSRIPAGRK